MRKSRTAESLSLNAEARENAPLRIAILYGEPIPGAAMDDLDTLEELEAIARSLSRLGHEVRAIGMTLDLEAARRALAGDRPDLVFNLVEAVEGHDRLLPFGTMLLDALRLPYTGAPGSAQLQTTGKLISKRLMRAAGLPTADWVELDQGPAYGPKGGKARFLPGRYIVKSVWEHASFGMDASSIVEAASAEELQGPIAASLARLGGEAFAERFIDGREFNISILEGPGGPQALPPAEIRFVDFADGQPKVVDWRAKWEEGSFEYVNTPRSFDFAPEDAPLLEELQRIALKSWRVFGLAGWARVDFRVDADGRPLILEINTNPCINPDAGFAAALAQAGIGYDEAIARIVAAAMKRRAAETFPDPVR